MKVRDIKFLSIKDLAKLLIILNKNYRTQCKLLNSYKFGTEEYIIEREIWNLTYRNINLVKRRMRNIIRQQRKVK